MELNRTIIFFALLSLVFSAPACADWTSTQSSAFSYDWSKALHVKDTDQPGAPSAVSNDITDAWHGYDQATNSHYFRMDLAGSISKVTDYGIFIDSMANSGGTISLLKHD